jgi:uncharacterized protein YoxC
MNEDFDEIIKLEDKIDRLEDDVKLCYEEIKSLETEIETLKKKGNTVMEIVDCQGEQIGQLIDIIEIYSKCFNNISDVVEQLSKNKKCTENNTSQKYAKFGTMDLTGARLNQILREAPQQREIHLGEPPIDKRRIPFYTEEHPEELIPKRFHKSIVDTSKVGEYVGTVVVTLRQIFKTIQGNIILGVEFDKIDDNTPCIHDGDYIKIHSAYVDDSIYFGKILTLKRFTDSLPVIPINSSSKEYGIQIKVDDNKVDFNKYTNSNIAIDLYR